MPLKQRELLAPLSPNITSHFHFGGIEQVHAKSYTDFHRRLVLSKKNHFYSKKLPNQHPTMLKSISPITARIITRKSFAFSFFILFWM